MFYVATRHGFLCERADATGLQIGNGTGFTANVRAALSFSSWLAADQYAQERALEDGIRYYAVLNSIPSNKEYR